MKRLSRCHIRNLLILFIITASILGVALEAQTSKADTLPVIDVSGTLAASATWSSGSVYRVSGQLTIPSGVKLTINPGAIIKYNTSWPKGGITVTPGGTLIAKGSLASPIVFTSIKDDSVGGDSGADGLSSGAEGDYPEAIYNDGGSVNISYASFSYGNLSLGARCKIDGGTTILVDSLLNSKVSLDDCRTNQAILRRNKFSVPRDRDALSIRDSEISEIAFFGMNKNTFAGVDKAKTVRLDNSSVKAGSTAVFDGIATGAVFYVENLAVNGTLGVVAGTIVKNTAHQGYQGIVVNEGGTLTARGNAATQVVFTSIDDDSVGGDSSADGQAAGTANLATAISGQGGTINISYSAIRNNGSGFMAGYPGGSGAVTITDSQIESPLNLSGKTGPIIVRRNHFNVRAGNAISTDRGKDVTGISLSGSNKNTFSGTGSQIELHADYSMVPAGVEWPVEASTGVVLELRNFEVSGTLSLGAGVIVKALPDNTGSSAVTVNQGGGLNVRGTADHPVVFTSNKDDSVGGDSGNDGYTSGTPSDYSYGVKDLGGTINIVHAVMRNSRTAISAGFSYAADNVGAITITDSLMQGGVDLSGANGPVIVRRNHFEVLSGGSRAISMGRAQDITGISLSGSNKNTFSGTGRSLAVYADGAVIPAGVTWPVESGTGAVLEFWNIEVNGALHLGPGVVVKTPPDQSGLSAVNINPGGLLNLRGTPESPVTFTSLKDDSIGGDTGNDGSTSGATGDFSYAIKVNGGKLNGTYANIKYASMALMVEDGEARLESSLISHVGYAIQAARGKAVFRGKISDTAHRAVMACDWGLTSCSVDAAYVDWDNPTGPFTESGSKACGQVITSPWRGDSNTGHNSIFSVPNCGIDETPDIGLQEGIVALQGRITAAEIDCSQNGIEDACNAISRYHTCISGAVNAIATATGIPVPPVDDDGQIAIFKDTFLNGVTSYLDARALISPDSSFGIASDVAQSMQTLYSLRDAYNDCSSK